MRVVLLAIGRLRDAALSASIERYVERLPWRLETVELPMRDEEAGARRRDLEAARLVAALPRGACVIVLDERGAGMTSASFAARLGRWRDDGVPCLAFLIGGADGHGDAARARADQLLSLGPMTWPHELVRLMLVEQLYRASTILAGHPYHRA